MRRHTLDLFDGGHELAQQKMPELADFGVRCEAKPLAPGASRAYMGQTGLQHSLGLRVGGLHQLFLLTRNRP